jgi:hypothetical protein
MSKKKILFIGGSLNQTTMMHKIAKFLHDYDCYYSFHYGDGYIDFLSEHGFLDFTILGGKQQEYTVQYLKENNLKVDHKGKQHNYDLVFTCSDLIVPKNIKDKKVILVQEGMTDPENFMYYLVKWLRLPRYMASTSTTGLSDAYDFFCVASEGYKELFISKGVKSDKIKVTGIPNFDNTAQYLDNDFPHKHYALVATSDARETYKYENRKKFILESIELAKGKPLIFKLHPNENIKRSTKEIQKYAPGSLVFSSGNIYHMIANCDILITRFSTVIYVGLALGKECYSYFDMEQLRKLTPIQNGGSSAEKIAAIGRKLLEKGSGSKAKKQETKEFRVTQ